jgi:hypothetical protein
MTSIYQEAMGTDFQHLHPCIQQRFGFSSDDGIAAIGTGVMDRIWHGRFYTLPFLYLGTWRRIMFPDQGIHIPFTIENYAYCDEFGRETVAWIRRFNTPRPRRFDAYMVRSPERRCIVDYLGTHQHLAVDIALAVSDNAGLRLRSGEQRFYEGALAFRFPRLFSGVAHVCEWYDDEAQRYRIQVSVINSVWGPLFGYTGSFTVQWKPVFERQIPLDVLPRRVEERP